MGMVTTADGTEIFYKDWGTGQPIVFSHGWPLSADDWDTQMLFFLQHGYRVIAHDRRGHGRSTQTSDGHDMDHYADDLAAVTAHLDLHDAVHVGHSTGGGRGRGLGAGRRCPARWSGGWLGLAVSWWHPWWLPGARRAGGFLTCSVVLAGACSYPPVSSATGQCAAARLRELMPSLAPARQAPWCPRR